MVGAQRLSDYGRTLDAVESSVAVDTYNVTSLLAEGGVIAIEAYYRSNPDPESADPSDRGGVVAILQTDAAEYPNASSSEWKAFDATPAFNPDLGPRGEGAGTGSYAQPHEDIDMRLYPQAWRDAGFDDSKWARPSAWAGEWDHARAYHVQGWPPIAPKEALPVSLRTIPAASFEMLSQTTDEAGADSYHYIIDFGKNFQGKQYHMGCILPQDGSDIVADRPRQYLFRLRPRGPESQRQLGRAADHHGYEILTEI